MNSKTIFFLAFFVVMAAVYTTCSPVEQDVPAAETEDVGENDQFYALFSSCTADTDCASRLIYKYCISTIFGKKCGLSLGRR